MRQIEKLLSATTVALCLLTAVARAEPAAVSGIGATSCREYQTVFAKGITAQVMLVSWAQGFMGALNIASKADGRPMRNLDMCMKNRTRETCTTGTAMAQELSLFGSFCFDHPSALILEAVQELYYALPLITK